MIRLHRHGTFLDYVIYALAGLIGILSLFTLAFQSHTLITQLGIAGLFITGLFFVWLSWRFRRSVAIADETNFFLRNILIQLGTQTEIMIFDEKGQTLWSTHPNTYPSQDEFFRKVSSRVAPTAALTKLKQTLDNAQPGTIVLQSQVNQTHKKSQKWQLRVQPIDNWFCSSGCLVTVMDVTAGLDELDTLKLQAMRLQDFVDKGPIGVLYLDKGKKIIGCNATLATWLETPKESLMGQALSEHLTEEEGSLIVQALKVNASFIAISAENPGGTHQPLLLIRTVSYGLGQSTSKLDATYVHAPIPTVIVTADGRLVEWNPAFRGMLGDKLIPEHNGHLSALLHPAARSEILSKIRRAGENPTAVAPFEMRFEEDALHTTTFLSQVPSRKKGELSYLMLQLIDISEQKRLERQFIQSQKMQAVGQLAGGIAHDFNNLLTAMIGFCDLLLQRYMPNDPSYTDVMQIKQNASRAANLVRQLLAFSRQQTLQPKVINITDTLSELSILLRRLIGAGIDLKLTHERELGLIKVDPGQLEQVIINMAVNARDAMLQGGVLTIKTSNVHITRPQRTGHDLLPSGDYIMIEVSDTGDGIAPEHIEHIFEPFFSTKEVGSGTGLGLSTAYGIVKQTGGVITVESDVHSGTTFRIYLPRYEGLSPIEESEPETISGDLTGAGLIMLVEDEDAVRMFGARALREKGYQVIEANSGEKAFDILQQSPKIDLLITDVVMPKMDGPTLVKKVRDINPRLKTIFISGYTEDTFRSSIDEKKKIHFLQKPFTLKDLASKVKEVLKTEEI